MKHLIFCAPAIGALMIAGCASYRDAEPANEYPARPSATADLRDARGRSIGTATITQIGDGIRLAVEGSNLPGGAHGIHIHQVGVCAAPDFMSAGPHWNPASRQHGKDNPAGMHSGDLPNILIGTNGLGSLEYTIPSTLLSGGTRPVLDGDGAALVVHATADDYRTDPSGNSGARIACGVFR
jgi:Cu-Zn family superoxide dismutase